MARTKRPAAQAQHKAEMDKARKRADAQRAEQRARVPFANDRPDKHYAVAAQERDFERQRAEQRSVGRVLLSADDLRDLGIRYSRVQLWKMVKAGLFPAPIKISASRNAFIQQEVLDWIAARAAERAA